MTKILIFSVEGNDSNTEINFFNGLGYNLPEANLKCYAIGKNKDKIKTRSKLLLAISKAQPFIKGADQICFLFVGDFDKKEHIPTMVKTAQWAKEIIEENQEVLFGKTKIYINEKVFGDEGHSIETSLNRSEIKLRTKNSKVETNKNLFNDAVEGTSWIKDNIFSIDDAICDLHSIESKYADLFMIIKCYM